MAKDAVAIIKEAESNAAAKVAEAQSEAKALLARARADSAKLIDDAKTAATAQAETMRAEAEQNYDNYIEAYLTEHRSIIDNIQTNADSKIDSAISSVVGLLF